MNNNTPTTAKLTVSQIERIKAKGVNPKHISDWRTEIFYKINELNKNNKTR